MMNSQDKILKLNEMLEAESFDLDAFKTILNQFKEEYNPKFKLLDFKYYNNYRRRLAKNSKMKCIRIQDFEGAAKFRDLEKECISFISLSSDYKIVRSSFNYDSEYLFYFYFGSAKNDKIIREYLKIYSVNS